MKKTLFCILSLLALVTGVNAQGITPPDQGVGVIYNRETAINLKVTTNRGLAPGFEWGRLRTYYRTTFYYAGLGELKHTKEHRQSAAPTGGSRSFRPYVYGKQNTLLVARGGWGVKRYFSEKAKHKGVALGMSYHFGPTLGLLKPYYLALQRTSPDNPGYYRIMYERYSDENAAIFLDNTKISGAAPFTKGFSELSLLPGANAAVAFHMDWGAFDEVVKALEIGLMVDVFPKAAPILVSDQNTPLFVNFFVNLQFGKRR